MAGNETSPATPPHLNQPDGPEHASSLPHVAGREREFRSLADAIRRLVDYSVRHIASPEETARLAVQIDAVADELEALLPPADPRKYGAFDTDTSHPHDHFQFDSVLGLYNPLALPVRMTWEPPLAIGHARFGSAYEGPPGCVHGGVISGVFDQVFNVANLQNGVAGPTANLSIDYRSPTPLLRDLVFEGWVDRVESRKVFTRGRVLHDGQVTAEAQGLFIRMQR
ncbi:MAG: PaaI family thioesterase [Acidimicrobiales bacterium]